MKNSEIEPSDLPGDEPSQVDEDDDNSGEYDPKQPPPPQPEQ